MYIPPPCVVALHDSKIEERREKEEEVEERYNPPLQALLELQLENKQPKIQPREE
jgi:hypothetical protein